MDSVTISGVTLSRELVESAYAMLHPHAETAPRMVIVEGPTFFGVPLPGEPMSEPVAREWARHNVDQIVDIPIKKRCEYCAVEFVTCLYSGLLSPRYCSRKCVDGAHPFVPSMPDLKTTGRIRRPRKQAVAKDGELKADDSSSVSLRESSERRTSGEQQ